MASLHAPEGIRCVWTPSLIVLYMCPELGVFMPLCVLDVLAPDHDYTYKYIEDGQSSCP